MLVIIVPFRATNQPERKEQLAIFLDLMPVLLPDAKIVIAEQTNDGRLFNAGLLINACFLELKLSDDDLICIHHVDLIPDKDIISEYTKELNLQTVRHIGSAWKRYKKKFFCTGIVLMHAANFSAVNGFPNDMWGWGGEDVILGRRIRNCKLHNITVERSIGTIKDQENISSAHDKFKHLRETKGMGKGLFKRIRWYKTENNLFLRGLHQAQYNLVNKSENNTHVTLLINFD